MHNVYCKFHWCKGPETQFKIYNILYCKSHIAKWCSQNTFIGICLTFVFANKCSSNMNGDWYYSVSDTSTFFAESNGSFQILEEYLLRFLCYSQCNSYIYNTFSSLIYTINTFSISFWSPDNKTINRALICSISWFLWRNDSYFDWSEGTGVTWSWEELPDRYNKHKWP